MPTSHHIAVGVIAVVGCGGRFDGPRYASARAHPLLRRMSGRLQAHSRQHPIGSKARQEFNSRLYEACCAQLVGAASEWRALLRSEDENGDRYWRLWCELGMEQIWLEVCSALEAPQPDSSSDEALLEDVIAPAIESMARDFSKQVGVQASSMRPYKPHLVNFADHVFDSARARARHSATLAYLQSEVLIGNGKWDKVAAVLFEPQLRHLWWDKHAGAVNRGPGGFSSSLGAPLLLSLRFAADAVEVWLAGSRLYSTDATVVRSRWSDWLPPDVKTQIRTRVRGRAVMVEVDLDPTGGWLESALHGTDSSVPHDFEGFLRRLSDAQGALLRPDTPVVRRRMGVKRPPPRPTGRRLEPAFVRPPLVEDRARAARAGAGDEADAERLVIVTVAEDETDDTALRLAIEGADEQVVLVLTESEADPLAHRLAFDAIRHVAAVIVRGGVEPGGAIGIARAMARELSGDLPIANTIGRMCGADGDGPDSRIVLYMGASTDFNAVVAS